MASSSVSNATDLQIVEVKSEAFIPSTDTKEHLKCLYDYIFHDIEPSNKQKLRILNDVIAAATVPDELRNYYMKRAEIYFNMQEWNNALNDINQMEQYGELNGHMYILKTKAILQCELEKARQLINEKEHLYTATNIYEYLQLCENINQMKKLLECTDHTKSSPKKRFRN